MSDNVSIEGVHRRTVSRFIVMLIPPFAAQLMEAHARAARAQLQRAGSGAAASGEVVDDEGVRQTLEVFFHSFWDYQEYKRISLHIHLGMSQPRNCVS